MLDAFLVALREAAEAQQLPADDAKDAVTKVEVIAAAKEPTEPKMLEKANKAIRGPGRIVAGVSMLKGKAEEIGTAIAGGLREYGRNARTRLVPRCL